MNKLIIIFQLSELIAALAGTFYITKYRTPKIVRYFVYFLWLNFFVELFGNLPRLIQQYEYFYFLQDTFLEKNLWLYNTHLLISYSFYILFFYRNLSFKNFKKIIYYTYSVFIITSILNLLFSGVFFNALSSYSMIFGVLLILISIFFYFYEVLRSDRVLNFGRDLVFYVALGTMVLHLMVTPIIIYGKYNRKINIDYLQIRMIILYGAIIFTYTCYTIGFIVCSRKNKSYSSSTLP